MSLKQVVFRGLSELYSLPDPHPKAGLRILLYHAIGTSLRKENLFSISPETFQEHMTFLKKHPFLKLAPLVPFPSDFESASHVTISFDDGYEDNLRIAAPILANLEIPFTVFVVPGAIQAGRPDFLSVAQLKELARVPGCRIGSHSMNHVHLNQQNDAVLRAELEDSRKWLEDTLSQPIHLFAYPYGSVDRRVRDAATTAGYTVGVCSRGGTNLNERDRMLLCRTEILSEDDQRMFGLKVCGGWDWYRWRHKDPASI